MIQRVDRPDDPAIAAYARVGDHTWLQASGLFVAEGRLVVRRILSLPRFEIQSILATPTAVAALATEFQSRGFSSEQYGSAGNVPIFVSSPSILGEITGFDFHRGCLALVRRPGEPPVETIVQGRRVLVMEGVGNPDNVGGLFRVAAAFGVSAVLLDPASADPFYRKAVRTSMGGVLTVPHARLRPWPDALALLRDQGFTIVALTPSAPTSIQEVAAMNFRRLAVLVGAEGPGLSDDVMSASDVAARIPMPGGTDSLNVTVAAGIAFSHLA